MKKSSIVLMLIAAIIGGGLYYYYRIPPKMSIDRLELTSLNGNKVDTKTFQGKTVLISFYKSWCGPCMGEMHSLVNISNEFKNELVVICISDESIELQDRVSQRFSDGQVYFLNTTKDFNEIGIHTFPTNFVIDKKGQVVYKKTATEDWEGAAMKAKMQQWFVH